MRAEEPGLVVLQEHVGFLQLQAAGAQRLHFPALQGDAGLEALLDEVLVLARAG